MSCIRAHRPRNPEVRSLVRRHLATALLAAGLALPGPLAATIYTYENTVSGQIPETTACIASGLARTFTVTDSFTVSTIALGFNATHGDREQLRLVLQAPGGSSTTLLAGLDDGTDRSNNYDIQISTNSEGAVDDGTDDSTAEPYYARLVSVAGANFYSGNSAGVWTLYACDIDGQGGLGTFNRAKLILNDGQDPPSICAVPIQYEWGPPGSNNTPFTSDVIDGVTVTLVSTRDLTGDGDSSGGLTNFTRQTATFGGEPGYYLMRFDSEADDAENVLLETVWSFNPPVRYHTWSHLDVDNGNWEDYIRVIGTGTSGNIVPYGLSINGAVHGLAGDIIETDGANVIDTSTAGNVTYNFTAPLAQIAVQYMMGNDFADPASQRIGIGNPNFCAFDFGDAPATYGTTLAAGGARHILGTRTVWMGDNPPDGEATGVPGNSAASDDANAGGIGGANDEDATTSASFPACPGNGTYSMLIPASNQTSPAANAFLVGYMDWNRDGDFNDAGEQSAATTVPQADADPTSYAVNWSGVPANCGGTAQTWARFRISTVLASVQSPTGLAIDGEVEDYTIVQGTLPVTLAWVASERTGDGIALRFATASETANAGFRIWGLDRDGKRVDLGIVRSETPDTFVPQNYEARVRGKGIVAIEIEDVALTGRNRLHGPFAVGAEVGKQPVGAEIDWASIKAEAGIAGPLDAFNPSHRALLEDARTRPGPVAGSGRGLLLVREEGIHRVSHEELLAAGIDLTGVPVAQIAVVNNGVGVARHIESGSPVFGPGSYIEFIGRPQLTLASPVDAYVLQVDAAKAVQVKAMDVPSGWLGVTAAEDIHRVDRAYSFASATSDPWYDQGLLAWGGAASLSRTFDLPNFAGGSVALDFLSWGIADFAGTGADHHVVVRVNGSEVLDERFDGFVPLERTVDLTGLVSESGNVLEVEAPGDTGYELDYVAFEGFVVRYSRQTVAIGGRFEGSAKLPFAIGGFADGGEPVSVWSLQGGKAQRSRPQPVGGQVSVVGGGTVFAAQGTALLHPGLVAGVPQAKQASSAEYLIVTHPALAGAVGNLVALEESRGLSTEVVTVDQIFAAYSDHAASAEALRSFLAASYHSGNLRYVLLVGSDTTDPYDHLGLGSVSYVPTAYLPYASIVTFSPTDEHLVDFDGNAVGEVPIGRLPVRTPAELDAVVAKLLAWEQNVAAGGHAALLAAGASDSERAIADLNESYASSLSAWSTTLAQVDDLGTTGARTALLAAINGGTPLVSFVGHSSMGQWDFTPLFRWQDVAGLTNAGAPNLVTQWGCWNSYYVEPNIESLSARLLRQPNAGAAATIGAMTLTTDSAHRELGNLFFARVGAGARTVGDALHGAKLDLAAQGQGRDALLGMALLGDPAMSLPAVGK